MRVGGARASRGEARTSRGEARAPLASPPVYAYEDKVTVHHPTAYDNLLNLILILFSYFLGNN